MEVQGTLKTEHKSVLIHEAVHGLALTPGALVVDATGGAGGHSAHILEELKGEGTLIIMDSDPLMVENLSTRFQSHTLSPKLSVQVVCENFRHIRRLVTESGDRKAHAILADLGWNTDQFETAGKGFSFRKDEPLIMTYGDPAAAPFDARDIVNTWAEDTIADALYAYADERFARRIAHEICDVRMRKRIETTTDLVACIQAAIPKRYQHGRTHPATKTFQALRIAVNDELDALKDFLHGAVEVLAPQGRLAVITFHSIEDRLVKQTFRMFQTEGRGTIVTKKPIIASAEELRANPRARSAQLRIFQIL